MVRITDDLLKKCTFTDDLGSVKELTLTNKEVEDASGVQSLVGLSDLNLAFNRLKSVSSLSLLTELRYLNVMHNSVRSLKGVEQLKHLRVLKVSDNQVRSLQPLADLVELEELWVHNNDISSIGEIDHLQKMQKLSHLWLLPNQCCGKLPPREYRRMLLLLLPSLQVVDTKLISEQEREAVGMLTGVERQQAVKEIQSKNDLRTQREMKLREESLGKDESAVGERLKNKARARARARDQDKKNRTMSRTRISSKTAAKKGTSSARGIGSSDLIATMDKMLPSFEPTKEQLELLGKPEGMGKFVGLVKRKPVKHSNGVTVTTTIKCRAALCDPKAHLVEFESKYPGSSLALVVHHDGSAIAKWPGDQLAICVDSDVLDQSFGETETGKRYSLFASYRSTRVTAVSFDMHGNGFVNWPNGQALLSYNAEKDHGVQYDHKGKIIKSWSVKDSKTIADSVEVVLDQNLAFRHRMPEGVAECYFACNTVRHKFIRGYNPPKRTWHEVSDHETPQFLNELNERNPLADAVPAMKTPKKPKKPKTPAKAAAASPLKEGGGPGISLSSISSLTESLQKLNSDLLNGSILKAS
ncbi:hypothetical protein HOP50_19g83180 [Chloropicon primus]|uniref:Leucine-rich repeat domain-containing protein n=1 Tax=Chloropicon primus TaxID=1764295 RepID=A0A5B8N0F9_9CHLO|nr:hypothetical protein A3770_19p82940 [Chloropicon primus]UPR04971.1 hypothetical protein HOP50_19g83180 [Chloropicon primus]|eukprot:QDZ25776.1 hypothetical protein A3770_19p82940 [Chloropicon primus]